MGLRSGSVPGSESTPTPTATQEGDSDIMRTPTPTSQRQISARIHDFASADAFLGRKDVRRLPGRSTFLARNPYTSQPRALVTRSIAVIYHETAIVRYYEDGRIVADPGRYRTHSTKTKITIYSPIHFTQRAYSWRVYIPSRTIYIPYTGGPVVWQHGDIVAIDGEAPVYPEGRQTPAPRSSGVSR